LPMSCHAKRICHHLSIVKMKKVTGIRGRILLSLPVTSRVAEKCH
jgi:hypothetical protein